jgi:hypothetical protein
MTATTQLSAAIAPVLSPHLIDYLAADANAFATWATPELVTQINAAPPLAAEFVLDLCTVLMAAGQALRLGVSNVLCTQSGAITVDDIVVQRRDGTGLAVLIGIKLPRQVLQDLVGTPEDLFVPPRDDGWSSRLVWGSRSEREAIMAAVLAGIALS